MKLLAAAFSWLYDHLAAKSAEPDTDGPSIGFSKPIAWTGHNEDDHQARMREQLLAFCEEAVNNPEWEAHDIDGKPGDETFCNRSTAWISSQMGYPDLEGKTANEIIDYLRTAPGWRTDTPKRAQRHANRGGLGIAGKEYDPHGHVAVIAPGECVPSGTWGEMCPRVAHIGKPPNKMTHANYSFPVKDEDGNPTEPPEYFIYEPD